MSYNFSFCFPLLCTCVFAQAQVPNNSVLRLEDIMQGEEYVGFSPRNPFWSESSDTLFFEWRTPKDSSHRWYFWAMNAKNAQPQLVDAKAWHFIPSTNGRYNADYTVKVYEKFGDIYWYDLRKKKLRRVTNTISYESNPTFSADEKTVFYTADNNIWGWNSETGELQQYSNFIKGNAPATPKASAAEQYLINQEKHFFPYLSEDKEREWDKKSVPPRPLPIYTQDNSLSYQQISPDGRFVTFRLSKYNSATATEVPDFVTESGYVKPFKARAKVGTSQLQYSQIGIYNRQSDTVYYVNADQIPDVYRKPAFLRDYSDKDKPFDSLYTQRRELVFMGPYISPKGYAVLQIKALDNKDRWLMQLDLATGGLTLLDQQHNDAWIGGPGIENWDDAPGTVGWLGDGETFYFQSEATGFSHLYTYHLPSKQLRAVTSGKYEVRELWLARDRNSFYLLTSQTDAGEEQLFHCQRDGSKMIQITQARGQHAPAFSPDEKYIADLYSYSNQPWDLYVQAINPNAKPQRITDSRSDAFKKYNWRDPQIVHFPAADGASVRARLYLPDADKKHGAAVVFVHGAGYLQNAHIGWSYYQREFMFHNLLADNGYVVLDIDYRGSAGYGADWRTGIYRQMGGKDLSDQVDGTKFLIEKHAVNPAKIGIYGGSYGGFITLMALFKNPETFRCGAALRSVTDWAHYNQSYTRDILNLPTEDSIAYQRSSPMYLANGLKGRLLLLHGMVDDNVQFQDVVRLSQHLIDLRKENWEMAIYPIERHGFVKTNSWLDEYRRIFKLFQEELR